MWLGTDGSVMGMRGVLAPANPCPRTDAEEQMPDTRGRVWQLPASALFLRLFANFEIISQF